MDITVLDVVPKCKKMVIYCIQERSAFGKMLETFRFHSTMIRNCTKRLTLKATIIVVVLCELY